MNPTQKLLRLDSITLHGIGSYFNGAELKLRPLTILCGTNGSGKSTWFNSIAMLQRSLLKGKLPFAFDKDDGDCHNMEWTNACVNMGSELPTDPIQDDRYGPPGTIGLNSSSIKSGSLFEPEWSYEGTISNHRMFRLLMEGELAKNTTFRVRLAHSSEGMMAYHQELVELVVDGVYTIRMIRARTEYNEPHAPYVLQCSKAFFAAEGDDEMVEVAEFSGSELHRIRRLSSAATEPDVLVKACVRLILAILDHDLQGFFRLTAIREKQEFESLEKSSHFGLSELVEELQRPVATRTKGLTTDDLLMLIRGELHKTASGEWVASHYVGPHGEATHAVLNEFAGYRMHDLQSSRAQSVEDFVSFWMKKLVQVEDYYYRDESRFYQVPPRGWVDFAVPYPRTHGIDGDDDTSNPRRWIGPGFRSQSQGPARFSSGFHQLLPIVTQCAVMSRGEIIAIENPEVHLHPKLQLEIAEFLIQQALTGRTILVETHSDLIIRRLMRAVLAEEIKQEALSIQFVSRNPTNSDEAHSVMEAMYINREDRIDNWPEGFLGDDLKESRRLLNVMYGIIPGDEKEGADGPEV